MSYVRRVDMNETLNSMYRLLPAGSERKMENFNGERKISVYRGADFMNKITQRLSDPPLTFIRNMINVGTAEEPQMATKTLAFSAPKLDIIAYFSKPGDSTKGVTLNLYRRDFEPYKKEFANLTELRQDMVLLSSLKEIGRDEYYLAALAREKKAAQKAAQEGAVLKKVVEGASDSNQ